MDTRVLIADGGQSLQGVLITHATHAKPRMVVIGTHGKSDSALWPMGNFAETMAESFEVPVMVVHSSDALLKWLDHASELRLCAGVDLTKDAVPVLAALRAFQEAGDCEFSVCHVKPVVLPVAGILMGIDTAPDLLRARESDEKLLRQLVRRHVGVWGRSNVEFAGYGTDSQLIERAESDKADILVVGTHHRGHLARLIHGSFSRSVLRHSPVNVLVVPLTLQAQPALQTRPPRRRTVQLAHSGR